MLGIIIPLCVNYNVTISDDQAIYEEGASAESRLDKLNQEMIGELRAEVKEEALEEKEMKLFGNLEDGKGRKTNRQTASYKLLYKMLKAFQSRVEAIELVELSPDKTKEWSKLLRWAFCLIPLIFRICVFILSLVCFCLVLTTMF